MWCVVDVAAVADDVLCSLGGWMDPRDLSKTIFKNSPLNAPQSQYGSPRKNVSNKSKQFKRLL